MCFESISITHTAITDQAGLSHINTGNFKQEEVTSAVNNGEKHLVDFIRQPDGKSLGILGQVT